jgi:iron complex outermembrane recepter protein
MTKLKILKSLALGGASATLLASGAFAEAFDIPRGDLASALDAYTAQTGIQLLYSSDAVSGHQTRGVKGELAANAALAHILVGTGYTARQMPAGAISIVRAEGQARAAQPAQVTPLRMVAAASAAAGIESVIVTSSKIKGDIQTVPIAITALSQEQLTSRQIAGGPDLVKEVPNLTFSKTNFTGYNIQIRGIGTQAISVTTDPAVAVAFNDTPFLRNHFFEQEFFDVSQVEVLRGPQGTLYGRNATAGVVNIVSAKPTDQFEAMASADIGNYHNRRFEGMINVPLVADKAALRIAGEWTKHDGYVKNTLTGQQTDGRDLWSTRATLGLTPSKDVTVNLIWEHFSESDDRLRSGKQLCHSDPGPSEVNGNTVYGQAATIDSKLVTGYVSQGCLPASLYSPDSFQTPNGYALPYYGPLAIVGSPIYLSYDPYASTLQSRNLRDIETHLKPEYDAKSDVGEIQATIGLPGHLTFMSETGFNKDYIFSFEDFNRFDTTPGVFVPGAGRCDSPQDACGGTNFDVVSHDGVFCDPQLGCSSRLAAGDLSTETAKQFSQEIRLSSNFSGPFNFSAGANLLSYDTTEKYYVFVNTLTASQAIWTDRFIGAGPWQPGVTDNFFLPGQYPSNSAVTCVPSPDFYGQQISDPNLSYIAIGCNYIDPHDIHHLNDEGRNYFLSKNPYRLNSYAAFGEAYYNITPELKLTGGLRWTYDGKVAPQIPSWLLAGGSYGLPVRKIIKLDWREPTGRAVLDWTPKLGFTDQTLVYASYSHGYKAGGANPPPAIVTFGTVCPPQCDGGESQAILHASLTHPETFKPEFVDAYELGTKNTLADGSVTLNGDVFFYNYKGYQISKIVDRSAINDNFDATVRGAELEAMWEPVPGLKFNFAGGYEKTRVDSGQSSIDLMDRTAGKPGWMIFRPFPTLTSNCIVPISLIVQDPTYPPGIRPWSQAICGAYIAQVDPMTGLAYTPYPTESATGPIPAGYAGYDPTQANYGEGFTKDLSGHELPNAPHFTTSLSGDYTLPVSENWAATLHSDFYWQSQSWSRIYNDRPYDKLRGYSNVNLALILTSASGWQVMGYLKNIFDSTDITGSFLNSDDTGLTTNVFLTEPRRFGIRVTKNFGEGDGDLDFMDGLFTSNNGGRPTFWIGLGGEMVQPQAPNEAIYPFNAVFPKGLDPRAPQNKKLDWSFSPDFKLTYQPSDSPWTFAANVRYGRIGSKTGRLRQSETSGDSQCVAPTEHAYLTALPGQDLGFIGKLRCDPNYGPVTKTLTLYNGYQLTHTFDNKYDPSNLKAALDRLSTSTERKEEHVIMDFTMGKDVGLGILGSVESSLSAGLRYAEFKSYTKGDMRGIPDMNVPEGWGKYDTTFHQYVDTFEAHRSFRGAGPTISWDANEPLLNVEDAGQVTVDWTLTGGVLFGHRKATVKATEGSSYFDARYPNSPSQYVLNALPAPAQTPIDIAPRDRFAAVPVLDLSLGLSYKVRGVKISGGYRWERYFGAIDGGFQQSKGENRTLTGPFLSISLGFGD